MNLLARRKGVAAVLGMLFMVLVFMAAIGAQVYLSNLQGQTSSAEAQAQQRSAQKVDEQISFESPASGLAATDTGPSGEVLQGLIMRFENGTVIDLGPSTSPAFQAQTLASGAAVSVKALVPGGVCTPGTATCLSKFQSVVSGPAVQGRGVGLVTTMGNVFWYFPSASASSGVPQYYRVTASQNTNSPTFVAVPGLSFTGGAASSYAVQVFVVFYQSSSSPPSAAFALSAPSGASFVFCGGLWWANPSQSSTDFPQGNQCNSIPNTTLGATSNTNTFCVQTANMCEFSGTAFVTLGSASGSFSFEFEGTSTDKVTVVANSMMVVTQTG